MTKFRDGPLGPTLILLAICLVITLALAQVHAMTEPVIQAGEIAAAHAARIQVLPGGADFTEIQGIALPENVTAAYRAGNGTGYVFTSQAKGFSGLVMYMVGVDSYGSIVGIDMFAHQETPGLGTKIGDPGYLQRYYGGGDIDSVDAVTGATRTTNSLKNSLKQVEAAYELVKEE